MSSDSFLLVFIFICHPLGNLISAYTNQFIPTSPLGVQIIPQMPVLRDDLAP
jgi:hypothetical protein